MDKGLMFLTLALVFLWLVFDDFVGKKRLSSLAQSLTPDLSLPSVKEVAQGAVENLDKHQETVEKSHEKVTETINAPVLNSPNVPQETKDKIIKWQKEDEEAKAKQKESISNFLSKWTDWHNWGFGSHSAPKINLPRK